MSRDKVTEALIDALKSALAIPHEQRLFKSGKLDGLFPSRSGANGDAAALALREEYLEVVRTETRGKTSFEWVIVTPKGVDFLHENESPLHTLQELSQTLQLNQQAIPEWLSEIQTNLIQMQKRIEEDARQWMHHLESLTTRVNEALRRLELSLPALPEELVNRYPWSLEALSYLDRRQASTEGNPPCSFPELFSAVHRESPDLLLGEFHEGLRRLQAQRAVQLLPMEGGQGIPQPEYALFDGARVLYLVRRAA